MNLRFIFIFLIVLLGCTNQRLDNKSRQMGNGPQIVDPVQYDFNKIKERGSIIAIVDNSSTSYFIYKGQPMGYEYDLLKRFANAMDLRLEIKIVTDLGEAFELLNKGEGDIIAHNLTVTKNRTDFMAFSAPHHRVRQVLVQRKPRNWRDMKLHEIEQELIRDPIELIGKKVHVRKSSSFSERLGNLSDEIGGDIVIIEESSEYDTERLIRMVAEGEIDYTVADDDVASLNAGYFPILDVKTPLSLDQQVAWGIRKNAPQLKQKLDKWIQDMQSEADYYVLYDKYFKGQYTKTRFKSEYSTIRGNQISEYDDLLKAYADTLNWDWRLLASMVYQESRFDPTAESRMGAKGLMQLVENTARQYDVYNLYNPEENIRGGIRHLQWLTNYWSGVDLEEDDRIKFILGSYNVGHLHVEDARRLAKKYGADPNVWDGNVAKYLKLKSNAKYFNDPVVQAGYCRGTEPVNYVRDILFRYEQYELLLPGQPSEQVASIN